MKKIIYLILTAVIVAGYFSSCKDMDSTYRDFIVPNGKTYPQKPDSLKIYSGFNRLRLTWLKAKDPSVVRAEIYWNNYLDTLKIDIPDNENTVVVDIDGLDESTYTFYVKTFDEDGNSSIPVEVSGTTYGENYKISATDRTVASALRDENYNGIITWNNKTAGLIYTEVRYTTASNRTEIIRVLPDEFSSTCWNIKSGELFEYRSVFLPPKGIDTVKREWITHDISFLYRYPTAEWTVASRNGSFEWWGEYGGSTMHMFDNNINTGWHSSLDAPLPQCLVVDMKQSLRIHHIIMYPPTTVDWRYWNNIEIYLSDMQIIPDIPQPLWGEAIAKVQYPGGSSFTVEFPSVPSGQYLVLVFLDSKTSTYINLMEFEVYGY
jgi:hypothetical protein